LDGNGYILDFAGPGREFPAGRAAMADPVAISVAPTKAMQVP
jgi:hypothetical protein